jgi:WD40 repeat protein
VGKIKFHDYKITENLQKKFLLYLPLLILINCTVRKSPSTAAYDEEEQCGTVVFDNQGNQFNINNNEIHKMNKAGDTLFVYSSNLYGNIAKLDVSNPMRPLIYYAESQKVIVTDNTLSKQQLQIINLDEIDLYQTITIANSSFDNGIWIYDQSNFQLIKINTFLKKTLETGNLSQILAKDNFSPIKMQEANGLLYLECKNNGILVFDMYGTFYKNLGLTNILHWNVANDLLFFITDSEISSFNIKTKEISILAPRKTLEDLEIIHISSLGVSVCENFSIQTIYFSELK